MDAFNQYFRETHSGSSPEQFGIQCCQITQIPASAFAPFGQGDVWDNSLNGYIQPVAASGFNYNLWAPVQLPSGVVIIYLDIYYYDSDPSNDISALLLGFAGTTSPSFNFIESVSSTGSGGYGYAFSTLFSFTVNNNVAAGSGQQLSVAITAPVNGPGLRFKAVDIWWYRQLSPAPLSATFTDVPTNHQYFQFIEALSASGITAGCNASPPQYCPDRQITRGEMAVYMAKALGLYWPY